MGVESLTFGASQKCTTCTWRKVLSQLELKKEQIPKRTHNNAFFLDFKWYWATKVVASSLSVCAIDAVSDDQNSIRPITHLAGRAGVCRTFHAVGNSGLILTVSPGGNDSFISSSVVLICSKTTAGFVPGSSLRTMVLKGWPLISGVSL